MPELFGPRKPAGMEGYQGTQTAPSSGGQTPGAEQPGQAQPAPAIPRKPSSTLKAYLDWARQQGQTPTFTNIQRQPAGGQFDTGPQGGAYFMGEPDGKPSPVMDPRTGMPTMPTPAIPGRGQVQERDSDPSRYTDPWDYADKNSQHVLPALWERMFPGRPYRSELTQAEKKQWSKMAQNQMKVLTEKGKYILKDRAKGEPEKLTLKQRADYLNQFVKEYNEMLTKPAGVDSMTYARGRLQELEQGLTGQTGAAAATPGQVAQTGDMPTPEEFRQRVRLLKRKHGNDQAKIRQELKAAYPNLPI